MAQRVSAVFGSRDAAERAADALVDLGADRGHISILARGEEGDVTATGAAGNRNADDFVEPAREVGDSGAPLTTADDDDAAKGAATGATIGAVAGLAAAAVALMVPGFGPVLAAGPLAWALGGAAGTAAAGAIAGGVYGGLRDVGIEEHHARGYEERLRGGDVLMTALVPDVAEDRVLDILSEHGAEDVSFADDTATARMHTSPEHRADHDLATTGPGVSGTGSVSSTATPSTPTNTAGGVGPSAMTGMGAAGIAAGTGMGAAAASGTPGTGMGTGAATGMSTTATGVGGTMSRGSGYNEESSLADDTSTAGTTTSTFDASAERAGGQTTDRTSSATVQGAGASNYSTTNRSDPDNAATAGWADSPVGASATTGAAFDSNANIARGEAKQAEGEIRDRMADRTAQPFDDLAAKGKKVEGKVQEEVGEAEETIEPRRP